MESQISIRLPAKTTRRLATLAKKRGIKRSALLRSAIDEWLGQHGGERPAFSYDRIRDLVGSVSGGPPDLAERHSEYLKDAFHDRR